VNQQVERDIAAPAVLRSFLFDRMMRTSRQPIRK
jgi:hypothetical protein